jgi:nitric oxide reductase subunit B
MHGGTAFLRTLAIISLIVTVGFLLVGGYFAKHRVAPIPDQVVDESGNVLTTRQEIMAGQDVFQRYGLMDVGSLWGHGTLRGMDFSAQTLHQMGVIMRDFYAGSSGQAYRSGAFGEQDEDRRAVIDARVIRQIKANRYDAASGKLVLTPGQAFAFARLREYWDEEFSNGDQRAALLPNTIANEQHRRQIGSFFFWAARASGWPSARCSARWKWCPWCCWWCARGWSTNPSATPAANSPTAGRCTS